MLQGRRGWFVGAFFTFLGLCAANAQTFQTNANPEVIPGEYVVRYKTESNNVLARIQSVGQIIDAIPQQNIVVVKMAPSQSMLTSVQSLDRLNGVELVEPNYVYRAARVPNDPELAKLWGMQNTGQKMGKDQKVGVEGVDIGAVAAWDIHTGSRDMVVAVIDTGVDYNNPDLKDNIWVNEAELNGKPGVDDDNNGYVDDVYGYNFAMERPNGMDDHGHGTHCSGTIGASGDNGTDIVGVNWHVRIMAVKFLGADGSGSLVAALKSINYAVDNGAKVLSNSWGGGGFSQALLESIQRSNEKGALFIAAAGNDGANNDSRAFYPAGYKVPNILSVAAIDNQGNLARFSNYGRTTVHVAAPGVDVYSTIVGEKKFDFWSGTSMATPHVSGVTALLWSKEPTLTPAEVKERIIKTVVRMPSLSGKIITGGLVNAYNALTNTQAPPDPNDPSNWNKIALSVSSPHPYPKKANLEFDVQAPEGTSRFVIHFAKFDMETRFDFVDIYDETGRLVVSLTGLGDDSYSPVISGRAARLVLRADDTVQTYGFDVDHIAVPPAAEQPAPTPSPEPTPEPPAAPAPTPEPPAAP